MTVSQFDQWKFTVCQQSWSNLSPRPLPFLPSVCVHNNTQNFRRSSVLCIVVNANVRSKRGRPGTEASFGPLQVKNNCSFHTPSNQEFTIYSRPVKWNYVLSGCCKVFGTTCAVRAEDCEGWWLLGGYSVHVCVLCTFKQSPQLHSHWKVKGHL